MSHRFPRAPFTPGAVIWGRVRKIGTGGEWSEWDERHRR
jgi:hypothetical protein